MSINISILLFFSFLTNNFILSVFKPFNNTFRIDATSDLIYVIGLLNNGVTLPDPNLLGSYVKPTSDNNNQNTNSDPWLQQWKVQDSQYTLSSIKTAKTVGDQINALYFNSGNTGYNFLNMTNKNQITFIATNEVSQYYLNSLITNLYNITQVLPESYSIINYLKGDFTYLSAISSFKYGYFSSSDAMYNYGFQYNQCTKNINWKNYASSLPKIINYYQKTFSNLFNSFEYYANQNNLSVNKLSSTQSSFSNIFYSQLTSSPILNITSYNLSTNITEMEILIKNYLADYDINPDQMNKNFTRINIEDINNLYRFINYDINTFSMLHTYLAVQPFLKVIENIFDDQISGNTINSNPKGAKALFFATSEYIFTALYKILSYNPRNYNNTNNYFYYEDKIASPFINFGDSLQFELWRSRSDPINNFYYVTIRNNFNIQNKNITSFLMNYENFKSFLHTFYESEGYDKNERASFCGTS